MRRARDAYKSTSEHHPSFRGPNTLRTVTHGGRSTSDHTALIEIGPTEIDGPFDLQATVNSGQTGMPEWLRDDDFFTDLMHSQAGFLAFKLTQTRGPFKPILKLEIQSPISLKKAQIQETKTKIIKTLDLNRSLQSFYDKFENDVLAEAFERFPGLRVMRAWDSFEALISCMLTQWSSVRGWNTVARRLRRSFGTPISFSDGSVLYSSVTPQSLANGDMKELRRCGTGFRAKYLREAARRVAQGKVDLDELSRLPYLEAKKSIMEIPGVGTKVADCFLLYGYGMMEAAPVDVWMHRVIQRLYLNGEKIGQRRAEEYLRVRFGPWAGYAQLYLYHYARTKRIL